ncbi:membrane fusion protein, multidrug efflux system [Bryocella elongata]|uniref:Membrane fusion protein, multidrug efflux system n=1 Tax=Bryocella elongata TaxID=863522 RepID=A0A1H6B8C5_9BACT|nr:HlyD family secretion protein [Bryocella elongata]SEG56882.1 membrane fusion protein, multidrug efflux system [Bryocella elongata]
MANEDQNKQGAPADNGAEEAPKNNGRRRIILILVVLVLVVGGFFYWMHSRQFEDTDDAQVDGNLYQVSSRVSGQVINVYVEDEKFVHKGDPIADIDPRDYQVALEQAQANLVNAQAEYEEAVANVPITSVNVRTNITTAGQDVSGAQASVSQAEAQAQAAIARVQAAKANALKAQLDVDRYTPLVKNDVISKQQYDAAVATATADQASLEEAERNVRAQQDMVHQAQQKLADSRSQAQQNALNGPKQNQVQQARAAAALASVKQSQAKVDQAQLNLSYCKIVAPTDGIVSKKNVVVGNNLSVGQDLLTLVPLTDLWVTANFKETQLDHMQKDQKVELAIDALGGRKFTGTITQIGGATGSKLSLFPPENATGNYVKVVQRIPVRIDFTNLKDENKDYALRPGMSVTPTVKVR